MTPRCLLALLALAVAPAAFPQEPPGARPELNDSFRDPDVASFVERFEAESREVAAKRGEVLRALGLEPGMDVADVGAGTGLYTIPIAEAVGPEGVVFAVDVAPNFLRHVAERARGLGLENVRAVLGTQESTRLPPESVDLVFICDTYHHFEDPAAVLASIHRALRPGGRLALIEFDRREGISSDFILEHVRADAKTFIREITEAGFGRIDAESPAFEENFFAMFAREARPGDQEPGPRGPGAGR